MFHVHAYIHDNIIMLLVGPVYQSMYCIKYLYLIYLYIFLFTCVTLLSRNMFDFETFILYMSFTFILHDTVIFINKIYTCYILIRSLFLS